MSTLIDREKLDTDPVGLLKEEIEAAKKNSQAVSRYGLAEKVAEQTGMPIEQAKLLVEAFCEENAPAIPAYLGKEFSLFWPKVTAFVFAVAGMAIFWFGASAVRAKKPGWMWLAIGTVVFGFGVFQWVRSLESYRRRTQQRQTEKEERLRAKYAKPR